jgi:hypothetical protein
MSFSDKLGLRPNASYVAFDYWDRKLLGTFRGGIDVVIEPHDTRVLLIHELSDRPQLLGVSRHITGAWSIVRLFWKGDSLRGTSWTVPGDPYTLWVHVPEGFRVSGAQAAGVPARHSQSGELLTVDFAGLQQPVDWGITFQK